MSRVTDALEIHLMREADRQIDAMIPPEGIDTFDGFGFLGATDLQTKGGSAAFGHLTMADLGVGSDDLTDGGSDAFGQFLVAQEGERLLPELDGMGALGKWGGWGLKKWAKKLNFLRRAKKKKAKKVLNKAAKEIKKGEKQKEQVEKAAFKPDVGPIQRDDLLKRLSILENKLKELRKLAIGAAREVAAPRIRRHEAKAAMQPVLKEVAKQVAKEGMQATKEAIASGVPLDKATAAQGIKRRAAERMTGEERADYEAKKAKQPRRAMVYSPMQQAIIDKMKAGETVTQDERAALRASLKPKKKKKKPWYKRWFGLRGFDGRSSGFLGIEDVTNPAETADILDDWRSDDIFGEPLAM